MGKKIEPGTRCMIIEPLAYGKTCVALRLLPLDLFFKELAWEVELLEPANVYHTRVNLFSGVVRELGIIRLPAGSLVVVSTKYLVPLDEPGEPSTEDTSRELECPF